MLDVVSQQPVWTTRQSREKHRNVSCVPSKTVSSPQGAPAFYRIAEVHFPFMAALEACAASEGGKQALAHAVSISSGGAPTFLVAEEETLTFD
jgi:hypothetical protein